MNKLYTIGCPACNVLEKKLNQKSINYVAVNDSALFEAKGFDQFPILELEDGTLLEYPAAVKWVNEQEA